MVRKLMLSESQLCITTQSLCNFVVSVATHLFIYRLNKRSDIAGRGTAGERSKSGRAREELFISNLKSMNQIHFQSHSLCLPASFLLEFF